MSLVLLSLLMVPISSGQTLKAQAILETKIVVAQKMDQIQYCYEQRLKQNPTISGRLGVGVSIDNGRVTGVRIYENTTGDRTIESCLMSKIRRWSFSTDTKEEIKLPFTLSADGAVATAAIDLPEWGEVNREAVRRAEVEAEQAAKAAEQAAKAAEQEAKAAEQVAKAAEQVAKPQTKSTNMGYPQDIEMFHRTRAKLPDCDGARECEAAFKSAESVARGLARRDAPAACKSIEGKFNMRSSKVLFVYLDDYYNPYPTDPDKRLIEYRWSVKCRLYPS